jgi:GTP-sensing pleiotropic transcriptional regulator CodY
LFSDGVKEENPVEKMTTSSLLQKLSTDGDKEDPDDEVIFEKEETPIPRAPLIQELESKVVDETNVALAAEEYTYSRVSAEEKVFEKITEEECTPLLCNVEEIDDELVAAKVGKLDGEPGISSNIDK